MREATGAAMEPLESGDHLLRTVVDRAGREPDRVVAAYQQGGRLAEVSAAALWARVRDLGRGLVASGVGPGDRVALLSHTRLEWVLCDLAILSAGAVTVPVYETSSAEQLQWILHDSGACLLLAETPATGAVFAELAGALPHCREALVIDDEGLDELARRAQGVGHGELDRRLEALTIDDLATVIYTSGTTGRPKGCMLTHGNLRANVRQNVEALATMLRDDDVGLQFLPLAHTLAKMITLVALEQGMRGVFSSDIGHIDKVLADVQPTMIGAVPRVFEKVYATARRVAEDAGRARLFDQAADVAVAWSAGRGVRPVTALKHALFDPIVYARVRRAFGGHLRFAFSGGGPLGERLTHFFAGVGVKVFEGYGLTETSPTLTINTAEAWKPGTVGRPVAGTTLRIADDGEVLVRGPQVFKGYWHNEAATAEAFDDGWFKTGDIGELDEEGFLTITGRKKELIVTAAGKNVAPAPLEDRLRAHPLVSQAVVIGDHRPFVAALVTIDEEAFSTWAAEHGRAGATVAELVEDDELRSAVQEAVDEANASVSRAEAIRKFAILPADLSVESGELTPTLKVRRSVVEKSFGATIEDLYRR